MNLAHTLWFCGLLVGIVYFTSKLAIEGEPMDPVMLAGMAAAAGYFGRDLA